MDKITFSIFRLVIGENNNKFSLSSFSSIPDEEKIPSEDGGNKYITYIEIAPVGAQFLSVYLQSGKNKPWSKEVHDSERGFALEPNPRKVHQIEPNIQTFVLIDAAKQRVFISNSKKKSQIQNWLEGKLDQKVNIKSIISKERFFDSIKALKSVEFGAANEMFPAGSGELSNTLKYDPHGFGLEVKSGSLRIEFEENELPEEHAAKTKVGELVLQAERYSLDKLIVIGRTEENLERIFSLDGIIDRIEINVERNEEGFFGRRDVFRALIESTKRLK